MIQLIYCHKTLFNYLSIFALVAFCWSCSKDDIDMSNQWNLSSDEYYELLELSDTSTIPKSDYYMLWEKMDKIQQIFSSNDDLRGTFTTLYKNITYAAIESVNQEVYEDNDFVNVFGVAFGKLYLVNLNHHLKNKSTNYVWEAYYKECAQNEHSSRLVILGMMAHITKDILDALVSVNVNASQEEDWVLVSTHLMNGVLAFEEEFETEYKKEISPLIQLYGISNFVDEIYGEGATLYTILNELRYIAFLDAIKYQEGLSQQMEYKTYQRFKEQQNLLELVDNLGLLP